MRPAMSYVDKFVKGVDTAKVLWEDTFSKALQGNPASLILKDDGVAPDAVAGDSIYSGKMDIRGPAHYNLYYRLSYVHGGAQTGSVEEGGGLGVQNPFRSRFIRPISSQKFPRTYTLPIDVWQKNAPMPKETFDGLTGIGDPPTVQPVSFALFQNYPNPFNPSTQIKYYLPEKTIVKLAVYNLLGQKVVTLVNEEQIAGNYVTLFEAHSFPTGIYFYELQAGNFRVVKKMMLLK
ncbi:MAG: T9SS type A sorting domain-containing protein [Ignavibacteriales bacterium]|nr:T9SS type A sorting domain-containing protein [Ignavibacteriales bacterium]